MSMRVRLLGSPVFERDGNPITLPAGKATALLCYLAHQQDWVPRQDLLLLFWPDHEESKARSNLRQLLSTLRHHEALEGLEIERTRVRWWVETDLQGLRDATEQGGVSSVAETYSGPLLEGFRLEDAPEFESWLELEREQLHKQWRSVVLQRVEVLQEAGSPREAAGLLERLTTADPFDEQALRTLVTTLGMSGDRSRALARFEAFRERLAEELGVEPEPETLDLAESLRETVPAWMPPARTGSSRSPKSLLPPRPPTDFVGRQRELALLEERLRRPDVRLVTLLAQGGMGKTRLALEIAHRLRGLFRDGVHFVPLVGITAREGVAPAVAEALGIELATGSEVLPQILAFVRSWEALLVLDNLEQIPDVEEVVQNLLTSAPGVRMLATSRARLNLTSEQVIELSGLTHGRAGSDPLSSEAATLFVDRARRLVPAFDPAAHEDSLRRICRMTGGMPLALELASSWLRVLPVEDVADELERGLDLLEATERDVAERHGSIRTVFDASWKLLSPVERDALVALSVFRGGFTRDAALAVADAGLPLLLALRNRSFLTLEDAGRFSWHPLVEAFVREQAQLGSVNLKEAEQRHAEYFFAFLEQQETFRHKPAQDTAITEITRERGNIQAAWQWAAQGRREDLFAGLGPMITLSFKARGYEDELNELTEFALTTMPEESRGWARLVLTFFSLLDYETQLPQNEEVYELLHRALAALQRHGDERGTARSLAQLGVSAAYLGRIDEARHWWQQARRLYTQLGDQARAGVMLENLMTGTPDPVEHERLYHEAHALYEQSGAVREQPGLLNNHALFVSRTYGHYDRARELLEQALALAGHGDPFLSSNLLSNGSMVALEHGNLISAERQAHEALELVKPFNNQAAERLRKRAWIRLAWVALAEGNIETATEIAAWNHDTELQVRLALLHRDSEQAHQLLQEDGLDQVWKQLSPRALSWRQAQTRLLAADVAIARGNPDEAWQHLGDAVTLACEQVFVPSALEAFVVASPLLPGDLSVDLLSVAVRQPAARFVTRQRAGERLGLDALPEVAADLEIDELLERARTLVSRIAMD